LPIGTPSVSGPFPYTTLFRSRMEDGRADLGRGFRQLLIGLEIWPGQVFGRRVSGERGALDDAAGEPDGFGGNQPVRVRGQVIRRDRKSTRLNSSHVKTSYAVF